MPNKSSTTTIPVISTVVPYGPAETEAPTGLLFWELPSETNALCLFGAYLPLKFLINSIALTAAITRYVAKMAIFTGLE